ncbi:MAG: hypothetical protein R3C28_10365 [Pirellulaceae bacterium]
MANRQWIDDSEFHQADGGGFASTNGFDKKNRRYGDCTALSSAGRFDFFAVFVQDGLDL